MEREIRSVNELELRYDKGKPRLVGYAAVFNKDSLDFGGFVERITPGAFTRSLKSSDIRAFLGHDQSRIIGRESNGTLALTQDARGLRVEITPPDTQDGRDTVENVRNGNLDGMSFGFTVEPEGVQWDLKSKPAVRHLKDVNLVEVSVVAIPAFPDTSVALRTMPKGPVISALQELLAAKTAAWRK
jgi:HK97 family phage prohead protease